MNKYTVQPKVNWTYHLRNITDRESWVSRILFS